MKVQMEVSLYPFGVEELLPPIKEFIEALRREGLEVEVGPLSSYVVGESETLFSTLGRAFEKVAKKHRCVLVTKVAQLAATSSPFSNS
jgi:uncharacterized protein YqgV (UPF0045/DUF77 family)